MTDIPVQNDTSSPEEMKDARYTPTQDLPTDSAEQYAVDAMPLTIEVASDSPQAAATTDANEWNHHRKYFFYVLIGGVIVSALISIYAILVGEFNDTVGRALWTTLLTVLHASLILTFLSISGKHRDRDEIVLNGLYGLAIASYFTAVMATWRILSGRLTGDLYGLYFYALLALIAWWIVSRIEVFDVMAERLRRALSGVIVGLWAYLIPSVFDDRYPKVLPGLYYRGIAAIIVLAGTIAMLMTIFHRVYVAKHPELRLTADGAVSTKKHMSAGMIVLIVLGAVFVLPWILAILFRMMSL